MTESCTRSRKPALLVRDTLLDLEPADKPALRKSRPPPSRNRRRACRSCPRYRPRQLSGLVPASGQTSQTQPQLTLLWRTAALDKTSYLRRGKHTQQSCVVATTAMCGAVALTSSPTPPAAVTR